MRNVRNNLRADKRKKNQVMDPKSLVGKKVKLIPPSEIDDLDAQKRQVGTIRRLGQGFLTVREVKKKPKGQGGYRAVITNGTETQELALSRLVWE